MDSQHGNIDGGTSQSNTTADQIEIVSDPEVTFEHLPDLVMIKILDYLPIRERLQLQRVSKTWQHYVDVSLRSETHISDYRIFGDYVEYFFRLFAGQIMNLVCKANSENIQLYSKANK